MKTGSGAEDLFPELVSPAFGTIETTVGPATRGRGVGWGGSGRTFAAVSARATESEEGAACFGLRAVSDA